MSRVVTGVALITLSHAVGAQTAPRWFVGRDSTLTFIATQQGAAFEGYFREFDAEVRFAPEQIDTSLIVVMVDTGSVDTLNTERDEALRAPEFFDVMQWPEAEFRATEFQALGNDDFQATGTLTIRDQTQPIVVPFSFRETENGAELVGEVNVPRLSFGVGQGEWADTTWIGANVRVLFRISLLR
jgi:polyisoprenoid-binding protein YceI